MAMKLEVFEGATRTRVNLIRTYNYVTYTEELNGQGSFEIKIPTSETSLINLQVGNFILFEDDVVGIIKGIKDAEDSDTEITVYGYMANHILSYRSFLKTEKKYGQPAAMIETFFDKLFGNPEDIRRRISFLELADIPEGLYMKTPATYQVTGKTFLEYISDVISKFGYGIRTIPFVTNYKEGEPKPNIERLIVCILSPTDRSLANTLGNDPVVFSFEMNNVESYEFEQNSQAYCTVAVVASEGEGQDRKVIEVQNPSNIGQYEPTGYDRIELYVDARDLQSDNTEGDPLTDEELEELMAQRGTTALEESDRYESFDASVIQGNYKYGVDYFLGDIVTIKTKDGSRTFNLQITKITKSISNGVEHLDVGFGVDWLEVREKKQTSAINKISTSGLGTSSKPNEKFSGLQDVNLYGLETGQIPRYNAVTNKWENSNETISSLGITPKLNRGVNVADINVNGRVSHLYAPESGSDVEITQKLDQGTNIADIKVDGAVTHLYAPPSGSGGSQVSITPTILLGTKIADYSIDGVAGALYAPSGQSELPFEVTVLDNGKVRLTYDD